MNGVDGRRRKSARNRDNVNKSMSGPLRNLKQSGGSFLRSHRMPAKMKLFTNIGVKYNNAILTGWQDLLRNSFGWRKKAQSD